MGALVEKTFWPNWRLRRKNRKMEESKNRAGKKLQMVGRSPRAEAEAKIEGSALFCSLVSATSFCRPALLLFGY